MGAVRSIAQRISYEIPLTFCISRIVYCLNRFWLSELKDFQESAFSTFFPFFGLRLVWICCILAETNRAPFDFVEGESELVSGFNVEYRRGGFAIIFIAEYAAMIFNRIFFVLLFVGGSEMILGIRAMILVVFFVWIRGTLPRMRYDFLIIFCWKVLLVVVMVTMRMGLLIRYRYGSYFKDSLIFRTTALGVVGTFVL